MHVEYKEQEKKSEAYYQHYQEHDLGKIVLSISKGKADIWGYHNMAITAKFNTPLKNVVVDIKNKHEVILES